MIEVVYMKEASWFRKYPQKSRDQNPARKMERVCHQERDQKT
jgi:hypothetical protein